MFRKLKEGFVSLIFDKLPFSCWRDNSRSPVIEHWSIKLPMVLTASDVPNAPANPTIQFWKLDFGHSGYGVCHAAQLTGTGCDSSMWKLPGSVKLRNMLTNSTHDATVQRVCFWLKTSAVGKVDKFFRLDCPNGIAVRRENRILDPQYDCPVIGMKLLIEAGFRIDADFVTKTVSIWVHEPEQRTPK